MNRRLLAFAACTLPALLALPAAADPAISDAKAAKQLLGKHALTLQWLGTGGLKDAGQAEVKAEGGAWRPEAACYYFINDSGAAPSFVVDVSDYYGVKRRALACYASQFNPNAADAVATRLTSSLFPQLIESRDAQFGAQAGCAFAEGFVTRRPVVRSGLLPEGKAR